jgi:hypothetical protein
MDTNEIASFLAMTNNEEPSLRGRHDRGNLIQHKLHY